MMRMLREITELSCVIVK